MPSLSVVVCTRNRGAEVVTAIRSILAATSGDHEVLVIDQSDDDSAQAALEPFDGETRLRYLRTDTRGLSAARNIGLRLARSPFVAMTDDDCVVDREWVVRLERAFVARPHVALVFGNVRPASVDASLGFIPGYERTSPSLAVGLGQKMLVDGVGACMALRRDVAIELGGFDEMLGAGAPYSAGEEVDLTLRVLDAGHGVYETPDVHVTHTGVRPWTSARRLVWDYWFGAGAAFGKLLRRRPIAAGRLLVSLAWRFATAASPMSQSFRLPRVAYWQLASFLRGLATGAGTPVDAVSGHFMKAGAGETAPLRPDAGTLRRARPSPDPSRTRS